MAACSEDVLLSVPHVRYKKGDGTLYVMAQRLAWMMEHRDTVAVSHMFSDIKTQKISPAGKPKVQLQVVLCDGTCSTFHFVHPAGPSQQQADRDKVKALLQDLLPKFKRQIDGELEMKSRLLSAHPHLKRLYEDLVIAKVLSSEQYWSLGTLRALTAAADTQEAGVGGAFLADIRPATDGCNGLRYNLTPDVVAAVFRAYPAVRRKHRELVTSGKMTEADFWTKFFQSHYFHRDRMATGDVFADCARADDVALAAAARDATLDITVDLNMLNEQAPLVGGEDEAPRDNNNSVHTNMIKRFNQHSIMVLKAGQKSESKSKEERKEEKEKKVDGVERRRRVVEATQYEDLADDGNDRSAPPLKLAKMERYLGAGPGSAGSGTTSRTPPPTSALASVCQAWAREQGCARPLRVSAAAAVAALGDLSPGGALMRHHAAATMAQLVGGGAGEELVRLYACAGELLRELWRRFPSPAAPQPAAPQPAATQVTGAPPTDDSPTPYYEALQRFRTVRLRPFEERMVRELSPLAAPLTRHLHQMLDAAGNKYRQYMQRHDRDR